MSNETMFLVHCLEEYKTAKNFTGKKVILLFKQYGVLDYIINCYNALHVTGPAYIIADIDSFIATRSQ